MGVPLYKIREGLAKFSGVSRRLEILGNFRGAVIIDDYAHHPTEIKASLHALRERYPDAKIRVFFHPHTFSRTATFLDDFALSFMAADEVGVLQIYGSAREKQGTVSGQDLAKKIFLRRQAAGFKNEVPYFLTMDKLVEFLRQSADEGQVIVLMGAGDIFRVGQALLSPQ